MFITLSELPREDWTHALVYYKPICGGVFVIAMLCRSFGSSFDKSLIEPDFDSIAPTHRVDKRARDVVIAPCSFNGPRPLPDEPKRNTRRIIA